MTDSHLVDQPTAAPTRKVTAATVGGGLGAAASAIFVWALSQFGVDAGPIEWAIAVILSAGGSFFGGYQIREHETVRDRVRDNLRLATGEHDPSNPS